jgi:hypothetical protein
LAGASSRLLQSLVDGDTSAENGGNLLEITLLGDTGNVSSLSDTVLLEGTIDGVTREKSFSAKRLIGLLAERAGETRAVEPLDTDVVTELDVLDKGPALHNNTSTFVSTDKGELDGQRPVTVHGMEIGVADTRELDVNQNFIWANFWNWDLLIDTGSSGLLNNLSPLLGWDFVCCHFGSVLGFE